jgi:N-methylhydantoinase B
VPTFCADLGDPVRDGIEIYGYDGIEPGDVLLMNYAEICGQHLNNLVVYVPVHWQGELVGFVASRAHWSDVGGRVPGSVSTDTTEIFQEGLQIRSIKVYKRGKPDPEILRIIRHNVRAPDQCFGDMEAQIAACELGRQRYVGLIEKYGWQVVTDCVRAIWDQCEAVTREQIRALPDGTYIGESFLDNDGVNLDVTIPIKITVIIKDDTITIDYSDLPPQTLGPMNAGRSGGMSAAKVAFKSAIVPNIAPNDGTFRPVNVILPPGTILSATNNAAMSLWTVTIKTIVDTILRAISQAAPDKVPGAHHGSMGVFIFMGDNPETGRRYSTVDSVLGGWGAQPDSDGFSPLKTVTHGDTRQVAVEAEETFWPVHVESYEWRADSAGPGEFRGGLGLAKTYTLPYGGRTTVAFERSKCPPWGLFGGGDAQVGAVQIRQPDSAERALHYTPTAHPVGAGGQVRLLSGGGGGRGYAFKRDVERVRHDLEQGYVTREGAERDYGVVFEPGATTVDIERTKAARARLEKQAGA